MVEQSVTPGSPLAATDDRLLALFFLAWRGFALEADQFLAQQGLSRMHHRVLYSVLRTPELSVGDLAAGLGISRQALHRPLSDLLERGLVTSRTSAQSKRERSLTLTTKGKRIERRASSIQRRLLDGIFTRLGPEAKAGWIQVMLALAAPIAAKAPLLLARDIAEGMSAVAAAADTLRGAGRLDRRGD